MHPYQADAMECEDSFTTYYGDCTFLLVEKSTITAAVISTSGGLSRECDKLLRLIAIKLSLKRGEKVLRRGGRCTKRTQV